MSSSRAFVYSRSSLFIFRYHAAEASLKRSSSEADKLISSLPASSDKNMAVSNVVIGYRDRPEGSVSKLNTYSDGMKVLMTIGNLYRTYKPIGFFGIIAGVLAALSIIFMIPVLISFGKTGLVNHFPTLFVCGFTMLAAIQALFSGLILQTIAKKNRQDFEMRLLTIDENLKNRREH